MTNIELYIDKKLCDIQSPEKLGVRLNRVLINPAELSTKDAQYSYSITIPATPINNEIFGYANVEEVKNKFNRNYTAQLYVDSIQIFDGRFKLSEIDSDGSYKGNLVVPVQKTIKEIFGEKKMTEIEGSWDLFFDNPDNSNKPLTMTEMLNKYNIQPGTPDCIFPLVLYGLLPKVAKDGENDFSGKTIWDKYVRLGIQDFPPSINCLATIRKIFKGQIGGTAFDDDRLKNLYMSYQNPVAYEQEWNWGDLSKINISGTWSMADRNGSSYSNFERQISINSDDYGGYYTVNLLNSNRVNLQYSDVGANIIYRENPDKYIDKQYTRKNASINIPKSGYYKVRLTCSDFTLNSSGEHLKFVDNGNKFTSTKQSHANRSNTFDRSRYEIQVLRDFGEGDYKNNNIVGFYQRPQFLQTSFDDKSQFPKYYPQSKGAMIIDPSVNENFICGLHWGMHEDDYNPYDMTDKCNYMIIANGFSWDKKYDQKHKILAAYSSWNHKDFNYWGWGTQDLEGDGTDLGEDDKPTPIWFNAKKRYAKLDGYDDNINYVRQHGDQVGGDGCVECIIWLERNEKIMVGIAGDMGDRREGSSSHSEFDQWVVLIDNVSFSLDIEPFRTDIEWSNFTKSGAYNPDKVLNWNDEVNFETNKINLIKFLPSEQKIDEWLDNFCKAFNLELLQPETGKFELNVKQTRPTASAASLIDLDGKASIAQRTNQPLGLPSEFQLGFKINQEEEGYVKSLDHKDGGGSFITGNIDGQVVTQTSNFSYNWFKDIKRVIDTGLLPNDDGTLRDIITWLEVPIITHNEIWKDTPSDYAEMVKKLYTNYAQRFWYKTEKQNNAGVVWNNSDKQTELLLPHLSNSLNMQDTLSLDYYNNPNSILTTYFSIIATDDSNYTYIECYLTPDEYEQMDGSKLVKFNGDLYYIAAIEGYDPMGRNKTKLKLIRKV